MNPTRPKPAWLDPDLFPFEPDAIRLDEGTVSCLDEGEGPPVLLLHGTPGWGFEFRSVVPELSGSHRVIVPDLMGFGLSDRIPGGDYTVAGHARRLVELLDHLELEDVHLVLHDFGGPIGLGAALDRPARVRRITVMNSWAWPLNGDPAFDRTKWLTGRLGGFLYRRMNFSAKVLVPAAFSDRTRLTREVHRHFVEAQDPDAREAAFTFAKELLGAKTFFEKIWAARGTLGSKVQRVVWGMADPLMPPANFLPKWREFAPGADVIEVEGVGHYVQEEAPQAVVDAIRETVL